MLTPDEEFRLTQEMLHKEPTVVIKIDLAGHLYIDGVLACHSFTKKLGNGEALRVEVMMMRAIDKAEERTIEKLKRR
jgi:hypothetical protein